jgi:glycosyltransferase involved in cell wall biosynthesis
MRILYLNPCGLMGGAETSLEHFLAAVRVAQPTWDLWLLLGENGPMADRARALGVNVVVVEFPRSIAGLGDSGLRIPAAIWTLAQSSVSVYGYVRRLRAFIKQLRPDLIHTNGFKMHLLGAWARPQGVPVIWHIHDYVRKRPLMSRLLRFSHRRSSGAIVNSMSVGKDLSSLLPDLPVTPIYNAVDVNRYSPSGEIADLDRLAGLPAARPGTIRIGLVATFARWKGHATFLEALSLIPPELPVRGYIIGGPIYQTSGSQWSLSELKSKSIELKLDSKVGFTGFLNDTASAMRALDIVVHASTEPEPFGMVIAEGMACGKAVIVSDAGGASELFEPENDAIGHIPGNAGDLARQIVRIATDAAMRARLGSCGREKAVRVYDRARLASEMVRCYDSVVNHRDILPSVASVMRKA